LIVCRKFPNYLFVRKDNNFLSKRQPINIGTTGIESVTIDPKRGFEESRWITSAQSVGGPQKGSHRTETILPGKPRIPSLQSLPQQLGIGALGGNLNGDFKR
jgi:hypothetical protein